MRMAISHRIEELAGFFATGMFNILG